MFLRILSVTTAALCGLSLAGEANLKEAIEAKAKKKYGPYVGVFGGSSQAQSVNLALTYPDGRTFNYRSSDDTGNAIAGFEVGYQWKQKRLPLELGLEFESFFMNSEIRGSLPGEQQLGVATLPPPFPGAPPTTVVEPYFPTADQIPSDGLVSFQTDLNAVLFMLNGSITLDLKRYRARLGPYLSRVRPYLGYGIGGAQLWFRETQTVTKDPTKSASVSVFEMDEFVFAQQFFAGVEYNINDRFSVYGEYRRLDLADFGPASDYRHESWMAGLRLRY